MYMAVDHEAGAGCAQQAVEAGKASVGKVFHVPPSSGGSMGDKNVDSACKNRFQMGFKGAGTHLIFCVHKRTFLIAHRPAQAQDPQSLVPEDPVLNTCTSFRECLVVSSVMVSVHIQERSGCHGHQKLQISRSQISAGDDQIHIRKFFGLIRIPQGLGFNIRYGKYFHSMPSVLPIPRNFFSVLPVSR